MLVFTIDRFRSKNESKSKEKGPRLAGFQPILNLSPFTSGIHPKETIYESFAAICCKAKSLNFAQYVALIKSEKGDTWMKISKAEKKEVTDINDYIPHVVLYRKLEDKIEKAYRSSEESENEDETPTPTPF